MKPLTIAGYSLGAFIIIVSTIRWYIIWYDPSQALIGGFIGLMILGGVWLHNMIMNLFKIKFVKQEKTESNLDNQKGGKNAVQ